LTLPVASCGFAGFPRLSAAAHSKILEILAQSAGELVAKDKLMDRVWPGAPVVLRPVTRLDLVT
jgi:hypothetical protein